jgi:hypothetical protein
MAGAAEAPGRGAGRKHAMIHMTPDEGTLRRLGPLDGDRGRLALAIWSWQVQRGRDELEGLFTPEELALLKRFAGSRQIDPAQPAVVWILAEAIGHQRECGVRAWPLPLVKKVAGLSEGAARALLWDAEVWE